MFSLTDKKLLVLTLGILLINLVACQEPDFGPEIRTSDKKTEINPDAPSLPDALDTYLANTPTVVVFRATEFDPQTKNYQAFEKTLNKFKLLIVLPVQTTSAKLTQNPEGHIDVLIQRGSGTPIKTIATTLDLSSDKMAFKEHTFHVNFYEQDKLIQTESFSLKKDLMVSRLKSPIQSASALGLTEGRNDVGLLIIYESTLQTKNHNYFINAENLVFDKAVIETFSEDISQRKQVLPESADHPIKQLSDVSGGKISILANKAFGDLKVFLRGIDGTDGLTPSHNKESAPNPKNGENGTANYKEEKIEGIKKISTKFYKWEVLSCPKSGHDGVTGLTGLKGHDGNPGGNSGSMEIKILDPNSSLGVNFNLQPGQGGKAGSGGPGGPGSIGSKAGEFIVLASDDNKFKPSQIVPLKTVLPDEFDGSRNTLCPQTTDGKPGAQGVSGAAGNPGANGAKQESCLVIGQNRHCT